MIHVIAEIEVAAGCREDFLAEVARIVPEVLAEDGCLDYGPAIDIETNLPRQAPPRDDVVVMIERWRDIESLEAHLVAPHMLDYRQRVKELVLGSQLRILRPA